MLSPALLRVCCLAVMAPALTKAVRQADGLTLLILPQKIPSVAPCKTQRADNSDRLSAQSLAGEWKGDSVTRHSTTLGSNGSSWQISAYPGVKLQENESRHPTNDSTDAGLLSNSNVLKHAKSEWCRIVGVLTPTAENSDLESTMNEDISETPERMGLLNANTSLDCDFRSKLDFSRQCASPICADMSAKEQEVLDDISTKCPIGALLSPPGSPKSVSGESTSTVTAHNPSVVTFVELEDAKNIYQKNSCRCAKLYARLKNLEAGQVEHLTGVQLMSFTSYYQNVFSIPCQRPMKHSSLRRSKDSIDLKAEFLQNEDVRNLSTAALVNLVRKYESSNSSGKLHQSNKTLASQLDEVIPNNRVTSQLSPDECKKIKHVVGTLTTRIKHLAAVDSDATESSSGGESCDELEGYEDKKLHSVPIHKRALWTWVTGRSPIAKRWTWLQSQVSDLEYRVRQIADLLTQARAAKSSLCFEENHPREPSGLDTVSLKKTLRSVNGYLDHSSVINSNGYHSVQSVPPPTELLLDGSSEKNSALYLSSDDSPSVSRTRPIKPDVFRKRKLLRTMGLHLVSRKAARLSSVRCTCNSQGDVMPCILCSGRYNNTQSVDTSVMPLLERVALLQPTFHPLLSFEKDIPLTLHFENHLKKSETYYHVPKPGPSFVKKTHLGMKPRSLADQARNHSRKLTKHAAQTLLSSARYRNSRHARSSSSKLRNRNIAFKKWRNFQSSSFKTKDRVHRWSAASSCSSRQESPVHSPAAFEDGRENYFQDIKRRRDGNQYDIDNIVIPYNLKAASSFQKLKYKEIITPKWRVLEEENLTNGPVEFDFREVEDISDETRLRLHDRLEIEERKQVRGGSSHASMARRGRRNFRYDSSGANTPDHLPYYQQDIMFQDSNSFMSAGPASPATSPPATPSSMNAMSDDSQPSMSALPASCSERRRTISFTKRDRSTEDTSRIIQVHEYVEHQPFEKRHFPLSETEWDEILKEPTLIPEAILPEIEAEPVREEDPVSSPGSPETSSSTSSALEDVTDPEWTVVRRQNGPERTLVLKLAKR